MSFVTMLGKAVIGTASAAAIIVTLPVLGPVGVISGAGAVVAATIGTAAAAADEMKIK